MSAVWTSPTTRVTGELITDAKWNTDLTNNLTFLYRLVGYTAISNKTGIYTVADADSGTLITADATSASFVITLPQISTLTTPLVLTFLQTNSNANTVTLQRSASDTINGATTYLLNGQYSAVELIPSGTSWIAVAIGAVGTSSLAPACVTLAKIQNATANSRVLGSGASGSGSSYTECPLGSTLAFSGTTLGVAGASIGDTQLSTAGTLIFQTGMMLDYVGASSPSGWVLASGRTIGDASSGGTERANADTSSLYALLWNNWANSEAAVSGGRGASAAADFAAHKTITLPDLRGRVAAGVDNMGGSTASRLTAGGSGITATTIGKAGGAETYTLAIGDMPVHNHTENAFASGGGATETFGGAATGGSFSTGTSTGNAGSGTAHQNTQPTIIVTKIIKL